MPGRVLNAASSLFRGTAVGVGRYRESDVMISGAALPTAK
jgi:hypothetical protein